MIIYRLEITNTPAYYNQAWLTFYEILPVMAYQFTNDKHFKKSPKFHNVKKTFMALSILI